jgi:hypothetical protein
MTTLPWHVEPGYEGEHFVGYVLMNEAGKHYTRDGAIVTWLDEAKAEVDCALINAGVGGG